MCEYRYITYLKKISDLHFSDLEADINWCLDNNMCLETNYYDLISVVFTEPYTQQYDLNEYIIYIKTDKEMDTKQIENKYFLDARNTGSYVLVKLKNNKYGYIHTENFNPIEFENQELIKNKLLEFLLFNNSP